MPGILNEFTVVLDACVLAGMPICDTLLRLAEEPCFFRPKWSLKILDEVTETLLKFGYTHKQASRCRSRMEECFPEALVTGYDSLASGVSGLPDPDDRHVVASALLCQADAIVTANTKHFPAEALAPLGIEPITPDNFLIYQLHLDPDELLERIENQAAAISFTMEKLLERLAVHVPAFVAELHLQRDG